MGHLSIPSPRKNLGEPASPLPSTLSHLPDSAELGLYLPSACLFCISAAMPFMQAVPVVVDTCLGSLSGFFVLVTSQLLTPMSSLSGSALQRSAHAQALPPETRSRFSRAGPALLSVSCPGLGSSVSSPPLALGSPGPASSALPGLWWPPDSSLHQGDSLTQLHGGVSSGLCPQGAEGGRRTAQPRTKVLGCPCVLDACQLRSEEGQVSPSGGRRPNLVWPFTLSRALVADRAAGEGKELSSFRTDVVTPGHVLLTLLGPLLEF